jgi:alginate O-acetyltransferase complex protein AlgI
MIGIVSLLLLSMKVVVLNETYVGLPRLNFIQWTAFALGWFGMRPLLFETLPSVPLPSRKIFIKGVGAMLLGVVCLSISRAIEFTCLHSFANLMVLIGLSLVLHFGLLNLCTAGWRFMGVEVKELFRAPYKSKSIKEFWGKRWNLAFSEMTALIIYKPLKEKYPSVVAMLAAFLFSGLLHEIAISFPVHSGYGLPMLYFVIHAGVMIMEDKSSSIKKLLTNQWAAHIWVLGWIIGPLPFLFHTNFIEQVLKPIRNSLVFFL